MVGRCIASVSQPADLPVVLGQLGPGKNHFCDGHHIARGMTPVICRGHEQPMSDKDADHKQMQNTRCLGHGCFTGRCSAEFRSE